MSKWSHLANAKHIDRIIAHVTANSAAWDEAAWDAAWVAAWDAARDAARYAAWYAVPHPTARRAILALVAWDHAGGLIDLPADQVKVLALLGDQAAILMYPAIVAMETTQEVA